MKVFTLAPGENWIVDRFVDEWNGLNKDITTTNINEADIVWLLADWCWNKIPLPVLASKKVLVTVHHIVPEKFDDKQQREFQIRDKIVTAYHVPNTHTKAFIRSLTNKPIHVLSYWANQKIWKKTDDKHKLRKKYFLPNNAFLIGSFQRDTEGYDLVSPKLEKGPDLLVTAIESYGKWAKLSGYTDGVHVLLAGWRRQYIMNRLNDIGISYTYKERPDQSVINELYQVLDLYPVTARYEGGPQSLIECGLLNVPAVSRDIGIASQVLPPNSINDNVCLATPSVPVIDDLKIPIGFKPYRSLLQSLLG